MTGAWVDTTGQDSYVPDLVASPNADPLPAPESKAERKRIAKRERKRRARGIGFAPRTEDPKRPK